MHRIEKTERAECNSSASKKVDLKSPTDELQQPLSTCQEQMTRLFFDIGESVVNSMRSGDGDPDPEENRTNVQVGLSEDVLDDCWFDHVWELYQSVKALEKSQQTR
jgi:hypothetical protein